MNIKELTVLVQDLIAVDGEVKDVEQQLKDAKERARTLREVTIPNVMDELSLQDVTLTTGQKLTITQEVYASIPKANRPKAFKWLVDNGFGGLIKTIVKTIYGKGERKDAVNLAASLQKKGLDAVFEESIHAQTLKAFLKEQIEAGAKCPLDLFGARPVSVAKIKEK